MDGMSSTAPHPRVRRSVDEARRVILDAAQQRLLDGGPHAVRVQAVAADVGVTDAAVHYHFGNREGLVREVVRAAGRRMRDDLVAVAETWHAGDVDLDALLTQLRRAMGSDGAARLTAWMTLTGWHPEGRGLLKSIAETIHYHHGDPSLEDAQFAIALLGMVAWADALMGDAWRRSAGLASNRATTERFMRWVVDVVADALTAR
jgi:TetR/AcrR family transcriptional regulator, repressor for neighboring sulfatase